MQCDTYQHWLSAYLDGELNAGDLRTLERHLDACAACTQELATLRGSVRLLRGLLPEDPPAELRPRIMAAIAAVRPSAWQRLAALVRLPAPAPGWGLAATGVAALVVGALCLRPAPAPEARNRRPAPAALAAATPKRTPSQARRSVASKPPVRRPAAVPIRVAKASQEEPATRQTAARPLIQAAEARTSPRRRLIVRLPSAARRQEKGQPARMATRTGPGRAGPPAPAVTSSGIETPEMPRLTLPPSLDGASDPEPMEPMTLMASMPMVSSGSGTEVTPSPHDALASLRQRLAEQRREVPPPAVEPPPSPRNARTLPVRFEF